MTVSPDEVARLRFLQRDIRRERELPQETTTALFDGHAATGASGDTGAPAWALPACRIVWVTNCYPRCFWRSRNRSALPSTI